jgi:hypothetical protein
LSKRPPKVETPKKKYNRKKAKKAEEDETDKRWGDLWR